MPVEIVKSSDGRTYLPFSNQVIHPDGNMVEGRYEIAVVEVPWRNG